MGRKVIVAVGLIGGLSVAGNAAAQSLLDQSAIRSPWEKACQGQADSFVLPADPRSLVVPGVNTNPNAAVQFNAYWVDLHNPPAPFESTETPNPRTCGEYRASKAIGEVSYRTRAFFMPTANAKVHNSLWCTSPTWRALERPADFDESFGDKLGWPVASFGNPYPKCNFTCTQVYNVLTGKYEGFPNVNSYVCEDPNAPGMNGGTGKLPLGMVQGKGLCVGGLLNGQGCDPGGPTGPCEAAGGSCDGTKYNGQIGPSCSNCHDSQFLKNTGGYDSFAWGRSTDSADMGLSVSEFWGSIKTLQLQGVIANVIPLAPVPWSVGRGSTDALGIIDLFPALFDMDSFTIAPSLQEFFPRTASGMTKAPNLWYRAFKTRQFWDGGVSSDNVRTEMAFSVANLSRNAEEKRFLTHEFEEIDNFLISLSPPLYPYSVTTTLAETGAKLFHERDLWSATGRLCTGGTNVNKFCTTNADCPSSTCGTGTAASTKTCDVGTKEGVPCTTDTECGTGSKCTFGSSPQSADVCDAGPRASLTCATNSDCGYKCNTTRAKSYPYDYAGARAGLACGTSSNGSASNWCNPKICWGGSKAGQICEGQTSGWCGTLVACDRDYGGTDLTYPKCDAPANRCVNGSIPKPAGNGSCASCHGVYSPLYAANPAYLPNPALKGVAGVITPIATIQTDEKRYRLMEAQEKRRAFNTSYFGYNDQHPNQEMPAESIDFGNDLINWLVDLIASEARRTPRAAYDLDTTGTVAPYSKSPIGPNTWLPPTGYIAPPLYGAWASAPFFHNGSVPDMESVLAPWLRPAIWKRNQTAGHSLKRRNVTIPPFYQDVTETGVNKTFSRRMNASNSADPTNDYDWTKLGWKYTTVTCSNSSSTDPFVPCQNSYAGEDQTFDMIPTVQELSNWIALAGGQYVSLFYQDPPKLTDKQIRGRMVFNSNLYSLGKQGHVFTQSLTAAERAAILEYMKTL